MPHRKQKNEGMLSNSQNLEELTKLREEIESLKLGWQRTQADFENFRRRSAEDQLERQRLELGKALAAFTPVAENFRRALNQLNKTELNFEQLKAWSKGIDAIARQLDAALAQTGVNPIDPKSGEDFNPHEHEAVGHILNDEIPQDKIIETIERGYCVGSRVLHPAKVIVSAGKAIQSSN